MIIALFFAIGSIYIFAAIAVIVAERKRNLLSRLGRTSTVSGRYSRRKPVKQKEDETGNIFTRIENWLLRNDVRIPVQNFMLILLFQYPLVVLGFLCGFLVAPRILQALGIYHMDVPNSLELISLKKEDLELEETLFQMDLKQLNEKYKSKERRLQAKIRRLSNETYELERKYSELLEKKPDKIVYFQPHSLTQKIRTWLFQVGGR